MSDDRTYEESLTVIKDYIYDKWTNFKEIYQVHFNFYFPLTIVVIVGAFAILMPSDFSFEVSVSGFVCALLINIFWSYASQPFVAGLNYLSTSALRRLASYLKPVRTIPQ